MLLSERKMNSYFSFMIVNIPKWLFRRNSRIESKSKFSNHNFSFILHYKIIQTLKTRRKIRRGKDSSFFDRETKWFTHNDRKIFLRISIDQTFTMYTFEINCFRKELTDRESPSFILNSCIISRISTDTFRWTKSKYRIIR